MTSRLPGIETYTPGDPAASRLVLVYSSGTTGIPKMFVRTVPHTKPEHAHFFKYDRTLQIQGRKNLSFRVLHHAFMTNGPTPGRYFPLSPSLLQNVDLVQVLRDYAPTEIMGTAPTYQLLTESLSQVAPEGLPDIERCYVSSGIIEKHLFESCKKYFPRAVLLASFASTEVAVIGRSCEYLGRTEVPRYAGIASPVHPFVPVEVKNPDERGIGELWVNNASQGSGDAGVLVRKPCPCGEQETLYVYGRVANDKINCAGAIFYAEEVERAMQTFHKQVKDYQLEVGEKAVDGRVVGFARLTIIPKGVPEARLAKEFAQKLRVTRTRTLAQLEEEGIFELELKYATAFPDEKPLRLRTLRDYSRNPAQETNIRGSSEF